MPIAQNETIKWSDLISRAKNNLQQEIENITGATIPDDFKNVPIEVARNSAKIQVHHGPSYVPVITYMTSNRVWGNVDWNTIEQDFDSFLAYKKLAQADRQDQLVSTRLILNFYENLSLFYQNRLVLVYSPIHNIKKLYYYNDGSSYNSWIGGSQTDLPNIEDPVQDLPVTAAEVRTILDSINANLKNHVKVYSQTYTFTTSSSSSCSSCSSSSSSSSSCWTIVHQDLSLL